MLELKDIKIETWYDIVKYEFDRLADEQKEIIEKFSYNLEIMKDLQVTLERRAQEEGWDGYRQEEIAERREILDGTRIMKYRMMDSTKDDYIRKEVFPLYPNSAHYFDDKKSEQNKEDILQENKDEPFTFWGFSGMAQHGMKAVCPDETTLCIAEDTMIWLLTREKRVNGSLLHEYIEQKLKSHCFSQRTRSRFVGLIATAVLSELDFVMEYEADRKYWENKI